MCYVVKVLKLNYLFVSFCNLFFLFKVIRVSSIFFTMNAKSKINGKPGSTSTPLRSNTHNFTKAIGELSPVSHAVTVEKKKKLIVSIVEAIKAVGDPRKGASYQAIKKWITNLQGNQTAKSFERMLKLAVIKGLSTGELVRPSHCLTAVGITGSFKLPKEVAKKPPKKTVKPPKETNLPSKVKKQTQEKTNAKKTTKVAGKKAPVKSTVAPVERNLIFSNSESDDNNEEISKEVEKKHGIKTASKKATKQISKKEKPVAKTDPSKTITKQSTRVKKGDNLEMNTKDNAEKEKKITKNSKEVKKGENMEENVKTKKQPKIKAGPSGQSDVTKKETSKTVDGKTSKASGTKKLYTSKNVPSQKRKDFSDTELDTKNHRPIPLKSYSSDTELEISKRKSLTSKKNTKTRERKMPVKKN